MADFNKLKIKEGKYWDVFLHEDQSVPGCVYFWYKDETTIDLLDIPEEAFSEFFSCFTPFSLGSRYSLFLLGRKRPR